MIYRRDRMRNPKQTTLASVRQNKLDAHALHDSRIENYIRWGTNDLEISIDMPHIEEAIVCKMPPVSKRKTANFALKSFVEVLNKTHNEHLQRLASDISECW